MATFRINKNKNYTTISNYHLKDINLSLKAKGLLSLMLSLPENWDYSVLGLTSICKEAKDTINGVLKELEDNNYLVRKRVYCNGKISDWEYNIYETNDLHPKNQDIENQDIENQDIENQDIENQDIENQDIENQDIENQDIENQDVNKYTKESSIKKYKENNIKRNVFIKPTIEEIQNYCNERNNDIDADSFYDFYESKGWMIGKNKMKDWKSAIRTWEKHNKPKVKNDKGWEDDYWNE